MTTRDAVQDLLYARGCPPAVVDGGLTGLVAAWELIVAGVEAGYSLTLDDYQNDMDLRTLIAAAEVVATEQVRTGVQEPLRTADARLIAHTLPSPCLWGEDIANEEGLDATSTWWYFRRPARPGDALTEDLATWGLL